MADVHSKAIRSYNMSRIRSKDTRPEMIVRKALFANGFRFRLHDKTLPGKPDIVLKKYKTVIFVNGCFWHGHINCKYYVIPKTRTDWWLKKITGNQKNDLLKRSELESRGWNVIAVFECELKNDKLNKTLNKLIKNIQNCVL